MEISEKTEVRHQKRVFVISKRAVSDPLEIEREVPMTIALIPKMEVRPEQDIPVIPNPVLGQTLEKNRRKGWLKQSLMWKR